ncbi:hypothetical protein EP7_002710 [Isosphaeraceae bacterium EP7]
MHTTIWESDDAPMTKLIVSTARLEANRRNAMRSTGPKTEEGKAKSRRNSLVHGLAATTLHPMQDAEAFARRAEQFQSSLRPMNAFEVNLVETVAAETVRIERCRNEEHLARDFKARRAGHCWADERRAETANFARALPRKPDVIAPRLASTAPGCDWLLARWDALGLALDHAGGWTDDQNKLALDLLGIPLDLRDDHLITPLDPAAGVLLLDHLRELVADKIDDLQARKHETLDAIEDEQKEATTLGLSAVDDPTLILLRRYETASFRRLRWAIALLHQGRHKPLPPLDEMTHSYQERPRDHTFVRGPAREFEGDPTPEGPDSGGSSPAAERTQPGPDSSPASQQAPPLEPVARDYFGLTARLAGQIQTIVPARAPRQGRQDQDRPVTPRARARRSRRAAAIRELTLAAR